MTEKNKNIFLYLCGKSLLVRTTEFGQMVQKIEEDQSAV